MKSRELFPLRSEQPESKDIREVVSKYLQYWYLFIIGGALSLAAAHFYCSYYTVPHYSISSTILLKGGENDADAGGLGEIGMIKSSKNINNEIEVLSSISLMQRVVSELGLSTSFFVEGRVKDIEIYGREVPIKLIVSHFDTAAYGKSITVNLKSATEYEIEEEPEKLLVYRYGQQVTRPYGIFKIVIAPGIAAKDIPTNQKIKVVFQNIKAVARHYNYALMIYPKREEASVLQINLVDPIPEKGRNIINKLVEVYSKEAVEDKNLKAASTIEFLDERLKYLTSELSDVEKDVEQYKRKNELTDVGAQATQYLAQASDYNSKLSEWAIQIDILESIEEYMRSSNNQYKMVPSTLTIQDPTLSGLIGKFNELQLERERILRNAFPDNPLVKNIDEQLKDLRANIIENLRNIKKGLVITSNNLKANSGQYQTKISKVPSMERELLEINRQQAIKQNLYLYLLQKREESALSLAANISNSRIIDPAIATDYPVSPNKQTIYLMSVLLGLSIPFAGIFVKDYLNDKVQTQRDVEQLTDTPILGDIMHNDFETLVVTTGKRTPIVEMFRLIRAKLQFAAVDKENKTMLVTSCMSGEGKTFFSINIAATLALTGKKVVVLELDLRNPNISKELGLTKGPGISDYLISNEISIADIIKPLEEPPGMSIISSGPIPPDPAELMMSSKLADLINDLKHSFDHIVIDTAPVGLVADAFSLSPIVDSTIYVVRYNYTSKKHLKTVDDIRRNKELKYPMIVMNDAKKGNGSYYGYGYGYENKSTKNKKFWKTINI
ncbi:GumC family protein [Pontibacter ramchanderi]|uniref:non-specific protein-tyrosine kinase n=1 Tax=Pontibacter ramchanderi TaxID=1179743 RepID=A0A2N3V1L4_9BACT|nr:polysaccharide biosynthesis tyrosine autokinase [Pontibacter ramchanderi]PKV75518.1 capsular exopolysaccharide synthesis family protein [Pontibacter ramchanderi]